MNFSSSINVGISPMRPLEMTTPVFDFPVNVLHEDLQAIVHDIQHETQASAGLIATSLLGVMASSCQDLFDVAPKAKLRFPVSLYQVVLAGSGERKSAIDKLLMKPIRMLECELEATFQEEKRRYDADMSVWKIEHRTLEKALERAVKDGGDVTASRQRLKTSVSLKPVMPIRQRLLVNDVTSAAVKQALGSGNASLGLFSDEAGSILNGELLRDTPLLNSLWSGQPIEVDRANRDAFRIEDVRFGCMLMVQPGLFEQYVKRQGAQARSSGFFARTLVCQPASTIGYRSSSQSQKQSNTDGSLGCFHARVMTFLRKSIERRIDKGQRLCVTLSPEASGRWHAEYDRIEGMINPFGPLKEFRDYASKQPEHIARIAAVLEVFTTGKLQISDRTMYCAMMIAQWYFDSFIQLMKVDTIPEEIQDANLLHGWLAHHASKIPMSGVKKNIIRQYGPNPLRNRERLNKALENLRRRNIVSISRYSRTTYISYNDLVMFGF
ncbi:YfjI family protein [Aeromonas hydrophila]|uniref:YfjI family protein n=1 Tax=Aeromonas hydrophila TaxID=644 RepID=UPI0030CD4571